LSDEVRNVITAAIN